MTTFLLCKMCGNLRFSKSISLPNSFTEMSHSLLSLLLLLSFSLTLFPWAVFYVSVGMGLVVCFIHRVGNHGSEKLLHSVQKEWRRCGKTLGIELTAVSYNNNYNDKRHDNDITLLYKHSPWKQEHAKLIGSFSPESHWQMCGVIDVECIQILLSLVSLCRLLEIILIGRWLESSRNKTRTHP